MENVTKALLIAGAVLIAIILLTMLIITYNRAANIARNKEMVLEQEQLEEYNAQFEAYNKGILYGSDVISLSNKVNQNNLDNKSNQIELYLNNVILERVIPLDDSARVITESSDIEITNFDKMLFNCVNMKYTDQGKISKIYIKDN